MDLDNLLAVDGFAKSFRRCKSGFNQRIYRDFLKGDVRWAQLQYLN